MNQDYPYRKIVSEKNGYPADEHGRLLSKKDQRGDEARELTSPNSSRTYVLGSKDRFACFDYAILDNDLVILHSFINSDLHRSTQNEQYVIMSLNQAPEHAFMLIKDTHTSEFQWKDIFHDKSRKRGWNQDLWFFYRDVCLDVARAMKRKVPEFSERQRRFGGKRIAAFIDTVDAAAQREKHVSNK